MDLSAPPPPATASTSAAPPLMAPMPQKGKKKTRHCGDRPHIKKPLNAFMLFIQEQRANVMANFNITESALVNTILGRRWNLLSKEKQGKYYEQAEREKWLHEQRCCEQASRDNDNNNVSAASFPPGLHQTRTPVGIVNGEMVCKLPADVATPCTFAAPPLMVPMPHHRNVPVASFPPGLHQTLTPAGILNGQLVYALPAAAATPSASAAPPPNAPLSQRRKRDNQQNNRPYIKKPLNAFMLFRQQQRENVMADFNITDSALVNNMIGRRWKSLSKEEQAPYYRQAKEEKQLHAQKFPGWSSGDNYGTKRKRIRRKAPTNAEAFTSGPKEATQTETVGTSSNIA